MKRRTTLRDTLLVLSLTTLISTGWQLTTADGKVITLPDTQPSSTPTSTPTPSPTPADTLGYLDVVSLQEGGGGWALSRSLGTKALQVELYVDGDFRSGTAIAPGAAN